jgi:hypothetical protein
MHWLTSAACHWREERYFPVKTDTCLFAACASSFAGSSWPTKVRKEGAENGSSESLDVGDPLVSVEAMRQIVSAAREQRRKAPER